jgi:hypothetical protein
VALAMRLGGERALPVDRGMVLLSPERLCRHLLVCGATGSGKTETVLRLAWTIDPNKVRGLEAGAAYIISRGRAMRAQVLQAPDLRGELPEPLGPDVRVDPENTGVSRPPGGAGDKNLRADRPVSGGSSEKEVGTRGAGCWTGRRHAGIQRPLRRP